MQKMEGKLGEILADIFLDAYNFRKILLRMEYGIHPKLFEVLNSCLFDSQYRSAFIVPDHFFDFSLIQRGNLRGQPIIFINTQ